MDLMQKFQTRFARLIFNRFCGNFLEKCFTDNLTLVIPGRPGSFALQTILQQTYQFVSQFAQNDANILN